MTTEKASKPTKLCPTCGTRVSEDAARCLVCGADLTGAEKASRPAAGSGKVSSLPMITLSLPVILGLVLILLGVGATFVYVAMRGQNAAPAALSGSVTPTITETVAPTLTPTPATPTVTFTPPPSPTPQAYTVKPGDTCGGIAFSFGVSLNSIVQLNPELSADCSNIFEGQKLLIPNPTPTPTAQPTATLSAGEATEAACDKLDYTVQENDTLSSISLNYAVPVDAIREYNGMVSDVVQFGQRLTIPLCQRSATPGPTPTATPPPPYAAPNLLLPADGTNFAGGQEGVTLQWASVGTLRENEAYAVTIEDITEGQGRKLVEYVNDTKFIIPATFRANDNVAHVMRWSVLAVRQVDTDEEGNPVWEPAGAASAPRVFAWSGSGAPAPAATPNP